MKVALLLTFLIVLGTSRNYPLFKQCDSKWAN